MLEGIEVHDGAVTALCHVLREIGDGRLVVPSFVVAGLGQALDLALTDPARSYMPGSEPRAACQTASTSMVSSRTR
jgi:hypothetical protein